MHPSSPLYPLLKNESQLWARKNDATRLLEIYDLQALFNALAESKEFKNDKETLGLTVSILELLFKKIEQNVNPPSKKDSFGKLWNTLLSEMKRLFKPKPEIKLAQVTNPHHRMVFLGIGQNSVDTLSAVAAVRGVKLKPIKTNSLFYNSDKEFLQAQKLQPGFYGVDFKMGSQTHATSIIIKPDGTFYILDPNMAQLKAPNYEEGMALLEQLIAKYDLPEKTIPWLNKKAIHHQIKIFSIEKI